MTLNNCPDCGKVLRSKRSARKHYQEHHSGEIETPEEYLPSIYTEQLDFAGEEHDTSEHNPEYLTENETPETRRSTLFEHERTEDSSLSEHTEGEDQE